jgi:hypothetical protein
MQQLHIENSQSVNPDEPKPLRGRGLKHRKLTRQERVRLAADMVTGLRRFEPSLGQAGLIFDITPVAIRAEIKARRENGGANAAQTIVQAWNDASESDREMAINAIGVAAVWDALARVVT